MRPGREQDYRFGADLIRKKDPVLLRIWRKKKDDAAAAVG